MVARLHLADWQWALLAAIWLSPPLVDLWRRRSAGAVLLDLGGWLDRWFYLLACVVIAANGLIDIVAGHGTWLSAFLIVLSVGIGFVAWSTRRCQLREAGIWRAGRLVRWDKIESYEISASPALHVRMQGKKMKYCCDLPPALRLKTEELLASKCQSLQAKA